MFLDYITYIIPSAHRELVAWMKYREESGAIKTNIIAKGMHFPKIEEGR